MVRPETRSDLDKVEVAVVDKTAEQAEPVEPEASPEGAVAAEVEAPPSAEPGAPVDEEKSGSTPTDDSALRYALIHDGKVVNVVLWDGDPQKWLPPSDHLAVWSPTASPGQLYDPKTGQFSDGPPAPSGSVTEVEKLLALLETKELISASEVDLVLAKQENKNG